MFSVYYRGDSLVSMIARSIHYAGLWFAVAGGDVHRLAKFAIFCFMSTYALQLIALAMAKSDTERLFECFSVISFCGMGVLKLSSLYTNRKRWHYLLTQISTLENEQLNDGTLSDVEYQSDDEDEHVLSASNIRNYTKKFKSTSTILSRIYCFTAIIFILSPFVEHSVWKLSGHTSTGYPHILPGWAPLDDFHFFGYFVTVLLEAVAAVYCVFIHIAFDLTSVGVMIFVCGQFSSLISNSERIGGAGQICNLSTKRDARAHFRIIKCHRTHIILVNLINELDTLIKNILGVYFFLATLTLCSVAVRLKSEQMSVMQLVSLLQYMCATITQLFLFCSYGDAVMNEIVRAAYSYYAVLGNKPE